MAVSAFRTLTVGPRSAIMGTVSMLRWPPAQPLDNLDYTLDITQVLADTQDSILKVSVAVAPALANDLAAAELSVASDAITVWLSGGNVDTSYAVRMVVETNGGRTYEFLPSLIVGGSALTPQFLPPLSGAFGPEITWTGAMTADFSNPANSAYLGLL